jgi:tetratricopeptide (TPR) repeat protein
LNSLREQLGALPSGEPRAWVEIEIAELLLAQGDYGQALVHLDGARRATSEPGLRERVDGLSGLALLRRGESDRAEPHLARQLAAARTRHDRDGEARALMHLGEIYRRRGDSAAAAQALERARRQVQQSGDVEALAIVSTSLAELALAAGDLDGAAGLLGRALAAAQSQMASAAETTALLVQAQLLLRRDRLDEADAALRRAIELGETTARPRELAEAYLAYAHFVAVAGDRLDGARGGAAASWVARAQALLHEHGALADRERVREAFRRFGRRATDRVAAPAIHELGDALRAARAEVAQRAHQLLDAVEHETADDVELPPGARARLQALGRATAAAEHGFAGGLAALANAEARLLAAAQSLVVEREQLRTLLELCRSLQALGDPARRVNELCKLAAQLTGADRGAVAMLDGGRVAVQAALRMPDVERESAWRDAVAHVLDGGGAILVERRGATDGRERAHGQDRMLLGEALAAPLRVGDQLLGAVFVDKALGGGLFTADDLELLATFCAQAAPLLEAARPRAHARPRTLAEAEKQLLVDALTAHEGAIPEVARALGVARGTVYNMLRRFALEPDRFRARKQS